MTRLRASYLLLLVGHSNLALSGFDCVSSSNVALYWGQNSYGQASGELAQQSLATYCANADIDIIPIAFLDQVTSGLGGEPVVNLANQETNCTVFEGTELIDCPNVADDIRSCQQDFGKTILLSIGGATYTEGGFSSAEAATSTAKKLWAMFGPRRYSSSALRPFGDAVIDGFDFDFESTTTNTVPFAKELRSLMDAETSKAYYLTAAPQCPYPDAAENAMLNGSVSFDAVFVQYYNNYCGLPSYVAGAAEQTNFNFDIWDVWAKTVSLNPDVKVFLGVPGGITAAGSGYTAAAGLQSIIEYCKAFSSFGGVMVWDASQAYGNVGFLEGVKAALASSSRRLISGMAWAR